MFSTILVPVDLLHRDMLAKALDVAGDLAKRHGARIIVAGVGGELPNALGHNAAEFAQTLHRFAEGLRDKYAVAVEAEPIIRHDPEVEITAALMSAIARTGADLVVVASHVPGFLEHVFASHGGYLAQHAAVSVFVVR